MSGQEKVTCGTLWEMTNKSRVITLIGAGGKTTCLTSLAQELCGEPAEIILTTTTKVYPLTSVSEWRNPETPPEPGEKLSFWYAGVAEHKWHGPSRAAVEEGIDGDKNSGLWRFWLVEGDGARGLSLKCWAEHEPQIPQNSQCAVLLFSGGLWGKVLNPGLVHRLELCPELTGKVWNEARLWQYLLSSPVFAARYKHLSWVVLGNEFSEPTAGETGEPPAWLEKSAKYWYECMANKGQGTGPAHLRLARGNAKEGKVEWYDLW